MNIYLVRHAQSQSNVNPAILQKIPNPAISLTDNGINQANETGIFLSQKLIGKTKIFKSPYKRTLQTSEIIEKHNPLFISEENIHICERQFGIVDDVHEYTKKYPDYINHYKLHTSHDSAFFARPPLGESPFDVSLRIDFFIHNYLKPIQAEFDNIIIVSHGAALRCFLMMALKWNHEQIFKEPNPKNASVRHLTFDNNFTDHKYIHIPTSITD